MDLSESAIAAFATAWFDKLNRHGPVEDILPMVIDDGLEMRFPEGVLRSHRDFRTWYATVGATYDDQDHRIEVLESRISGATAEVQVVVVWTARLKSGEGRIAARARQTWRLQAAPGGGSPKIFYYAVDSFEPLPADPQPQPEEHE